MNASRGASDAGEAAWGWSRLCKALGAMLVLGAALALAISAWRSAAGDDVVTAFRSTSLFEARKLMSPTGSDSWTPMLEATRLAHDGQPGSIYRRALDERRCKFQYPPASLLLFEVIETAPRPLACDAPAGDEAHLDARAWPLKRWMDGAQRVALLLTIALAACIAATAVGSSAAYGTRRRVDARLMLFGALALLCGLSFYPLVRAYSLGQVQVFLNLMTAAAVLGLLRSANGLSGALLGACCLLKPQYALLIFWGLTRRDWRFTVGFVAVAGLGHGAALAMYGVHMHLDYLAFLQEIAKVGEVFWPNQTFNGLLNRLLGEGDPTRWQYIEFAAYHPWVRWGTLLSSAVIVALALWPAGARRRDRLSHAIDFAAMLAASTLAAPIAWEHHYGGFLALFALALVALARRVTAAPAAWSVLGLAYVMVANEMLRPDLWFASPTLGIAASHLWFGAMMLFGVLLWLRLEPRVAARPPPRQEPLLGARALSSASR